MTEPSPIAAVEMSARRAWTLAVLIAAVFFAAVAPTLRWLDYTNGNENIVVQTALQMRHGGPKLLPQLNGEPRVKKPPLVAWVTAAAMRPSTIQQLDDPKARDAAYHDLAFQTRLPALLAGCLVILATFEIGRVWGGGAVGLSAAMVVATNLLFLKYIRQSTTDAHLAAWVAITNAFLFHGLLRGRWWVACAGGGVTLGLAFMCKGPVALVETVVPAIAAAAVLRGAVKSRFGRVNNSGPLPLPPPAREEGMKIVLPVFLGVLVFAAIALPWFIYVLTTVKGVGSTWTSEVSREGATNLEVGNPRVYLLLGPMMAPWLVFGVVGLLALWQRRREAAAWLPTVFCVVPLLVMVWFRDRKDRYMLPLVVPAAIICGYGVVVWMRSWATQRNVADKLVLALHTLLLLGLSVGLLIAGHLSLRTVFERPWYPKAMVAWGVVAVAAFAMLTGLLQRRRAWAVPGGSFLLMLGVLTVFLVGYRNSRDGRSPLKPLTDAIVEQAPGAVVYDWLPRGRVDEQIALYLNRTILRADPATLQPIDRPMVLIMRQARQDDLPLPPKGWSLIATADEGAAKWFAFLRRPR
jgi:4-amino-4-deoxy-L-arabinose transferase-like glycosyltransferase